MSRLPVQECAVVSGRPFRFLGFRKGFFWQAVQVDDDRVEVQEDVDGFLRNFCH